VIGDAGQVAVMAAVGDLVDADADQALEPALVEMVGDDALDDPPDGVPADPQQPADRRAGHLLGQPGDDVLEVARVRGAGARPRHRLQANAAVAAAQAPQLALDDAAAGAEIEVAPALDPSVVDLELPAGLPAARADAPATAQTDGHDHPLGAEADIDNGCPGQAEQPLECAGDAHVALLEEPLISTTSSLQPRAAARRLRSAQPPRTSAAAKSLLTRSRARRVHPQVERRPQRIHPNPVPEQRDGDVAVRTSRYPLGTRLSARRGIFPRGMLHGMSPVASRTSKRGACCNRRPLPLVAGSGHPSRSGNAENTLWRGS
jgi:hypothetical protein